MPYSFDNFKLTLLGSAMTMRQAAEDVLMDMTNQDNSLSDMGYNLHREASLQFSTCAAGLLISKYFFELAYKDKKIDIYDVAHVHARALRKPLNDTKENLPEPLFGGPNFKKTLKTILKNSSALYAEKYVDEPEEMIPPVIADRMVNLQAGYYLMNCAHACPILNGIERVEQDSAFLAAYEIRKSRLKTDNTAIQNRELDNELRIVQAFFQTNNFNNFGLSKDFLDHNPIVQDVAQWAGEQYKKPSKIFLSLN